MSKPIPFMVWILFMATCAAIPAPGLYGLVLALRREIATKDDLIAAQSILIEAKQREVAGWCKVARTGGVVIEEQGLRLGEQTRLIDTMRSRISDLETGLAR